ncbi:MAG: 4Fe-4S dicluster domain-containing protein [Candidatus Heimdallarchaeum aukensis]|uniref:4Fe-4S dicluster domain-containing protein n=1 Tax=Candidatus Heimdallarchaeum aukensis TaxID=2876573 RepID=A0A9Y1BKH2_9ARCH|nr:MAG: 4Fe-4S dicluster domain-containing protein [Candidatus Heimdallarchaeum aukensis]
MSFEYIKIGKEEKEFISKIEDISGQNLYACYQCGKCTAGCSFSNQMDLTVNQVIHRLQLGQKEKVLSAKSPWVCASCLTCTVRCPRDIDVAAIMESVREYILRYEPERIERMKVTGEKAKNLPNIALVGSFRKNTEL